MTALEISQQSLLLLLAHGFVFRFVGEPRLLHLLEQALNRCTYRICKLFNRYFSHQSLLLKRPIL